MNTSRIMIQTLLLFISRRIALGFAILLCFVLLPQTSLFAQRMIVQDIAGSWSTFSSNGFTPRGAFTTQEVGGKIYVIGGFNGADYMSTIEVYDPATDSWDSIVAPGFTPRRGMSSVVVGGRVYTFGGANGSGGSNGSGALSTFEVFDPTTNTWSTPVTTGVMTPRWRSCSVLLRDKVYVMGGFNNGTVNTVEIFDTLTNTWSPGDTISFGARSDFCAFNVNGKIYVVGGQGDTLSPQVFDPNSNEWTTPTTSGNYLERQGLSGALINGEIYAFGGDNGGMFSNTFDIFNPATNTWTTPETSGIAIARAGGCATLFNGKVYIMGGRDVWGQLDTNSVFTPSFSSVSDTISSIGISIFPNPTDGMVTMHSDRSTMGLNITVTNVLGQILLRKMVESGSSDIMLDLSRFAQGVYCVRMRAGDSLFERTIIKR